MNKLQKIFLICGIIEVLLGAVAIYSAYINTRGNPEDFDEAGGTWGQMMVFLGALTLFSTPAYDSKFVVFVILGTAGFIGGIATYFIIQELFMGRIPDPFFIAHSLLFFISLYGILLSFRKA
ncbi:hypothetical protein E3E31_04635 [Thermococcus sp. M39]|uniref:hypothetical protein n=1 Tax=unclassified Thermococcus TaxID=2627626 RepID=UPI00143C3BB3|nr:MULTISPECIES: hypothetical protein [unclassified Thermococcus]NJE07815.1 hypothetical protein [Thermococcus sp. M39]NJE12369.1 hypothetical protein [Thermococcus sp. LS2]